MSEPSSTRPDDWGGEFDIDGKKVEWRPNAIGGFFIMFGGIYFLHFQGEPSEQRVRDFLTGWQGGFVDGQNEN